MTKSIAHGNGNCGATEGADIALNWISAQVGQSEPGRPLWSGPCGVVPFDCDIRTADESAVDGACT